MKTLDEIIKENNDPKLLRNELLKNFEENISAIRSESIFLMKDASLSGPRMNILFMYIIFGFYLNHR